MKKIQNLVQVMRWIYIIFALVAGVGLAVQAGANTQLKTSVGDPFKVSLYSFIIGTIALAIIVLFNRNISSSCGHLLQASWWHWTGGILGAVYVVAVIILAPKLGVFYLFGLLVVGQIICSLLIDHFALLGFEHRPITFSKIIGLLFLVVGLFIIQNSKT